MQRVFFIIYIAKVAFPYTKQYFSSQYLFLFFWYHKEN